jgi:PAS domain S-box-containing protein
VDEQASDLVQEALLGQAIAASAHAVFVSEETGRLLAVNDAACQLLGYRRAELLAMSAGDYAATPVKRRADVFRRLQRGEAVSSTARLRHRDGSIVEIDYWGTQTRVGAIGFLLTVTAPIETVRRLPGAPVGGGAERPSA